MNNITNVQELAEHVKMLEGKDEALLIVAGVMLSIVIIEKAVRIVIAFVRRG